MSSCEFGIFTKGLREYLRELIEEGGRNRVILGGFHGGLHWCLIISGEVVVFWA